MKLQYLTYVKDTNPNAHNKVFKKANNVATLTLVHD
jgi:hypothetical protein